MKNVSFKNISFSRCPGKSHVYLSDLIKINKKSFSIYSKDKNKVMVSSKKCLYKYVRYDHFKSNVNHKEILFFSPMSWEDPFDYLFYANHNMPIEKGDKVDIACLCTSYKRENDEDASWKMYGMDYIRVGFSFFKLLDVLEDIAIKTNPTIGLNFYVSVIDYTYGKKGLNNLSKSYGHPYSSLYECLSLHSLKRVGFEYEREIRIFAVGKGLYQEGKQYYSVKKVKYDKDLVPSIYLPPLTPMKSENPRCKYYKGIQSIMNRGLKEEFKTLVPNCRLSQSKLYAI